MIELIKYFEIISYHYYYLQGQGKYNGISELDTLFPFSFTIPLLAVVKILSGAEHINRWPLGHSYSTPINIFTENSTQNHQT